MSGPRPLAPDDLAVYALEGLALMPEARIEDACKWLVQATRGAEHAVADEGHARVRLTREWASLTPALPGDRLVEPLRPDGWLVRLHLRPAKAAGLAEEAVLEGFLAGARVVEADVSAFVYAWQALGTRLGQQPRRHLTPEAWTRLDRAIQAAGYPAVHHSAPYAQAYAPAYRVMRRTDADALRAADALT